MNSHPPRRSFLWLFLAILGWTTATVMAQPFDIAPFARRCTGARTYRETTLFDYAYAQRAPAQFERLGDQFIYALQWAEERDIREVRVQFADAVTATNITLEYWLQNWPYPAPVMPTIEDPVDDPWQGRWVLARTDRSNQGSDCVFTFQPLDNEENPKAGHLPGVNYRRTLKLRLGAIERVPKVRQVQVFSESTQQVMPLRLELGVRGAVRTPWEGRLEAYNGSIEHVRGWKTNRSDRVDGCAFHVGPGKGLVFDVHGTRPAPSGSHDVTIVTVRAGDKTFSFALTDAEKGPLYLPDFDVYITPAADPQSFSPTIVKAGERIREKLAKEPEQTYERASREIPSLDPVERQGGRLYLPLTIDSSWQKFAVEWGGNIFLEKNALKARGDDLRRLEWPGNRLGWRIGTGTSPNFRPATADSVLHVREDYLPVAIATWKTGAIEYQEEAFATALSGPLNWPGRDEYSPVVLLVQITARNTSAEPQDSHLWLGISPDQALQFERQELLSEDGELLRARTLSTSETPWQLNAFEDLGKPIRGLHRQTSLPAHGIDTVVLALPFLPRLTEAQRAQMGALNYEQERAKVVAYWKAIAERDVRFEVPEPRLVSFSRSMLMHMHLSTSREPQSGLLLVPAASYHYQVFANESCFQILTLDALGDHQTATDYLETFLKLQGSRPFVGTYTGDQREVFHGAKVAPGYDYTAQEYNLDHGTVLWTMAEHYFMTRDRDWLRRAAPSLVRAADWVTVQRRQTMALENGAPVREYGLLPAGHLEDNPDWGHWFAVNAYASAGMSRLADALKEIAHPETDRLRRDAEAYRADLRRAVLRASQEAPVTRLRDQTYVPCFPVRPHQRQRLFGPLRVAYYQRYPNQVVPTYRLSATREVLYGPLILLNLGIFDVREPIGAWLLDDWEDNLTMSTSFGLNVHGWVDDEYWFSRGGMVFQANLQNPVLTYLRRQEIPAALRNLYNDFVACYYPDVNAFTEEFRQWRSPSGPFFKTPDEARFVSRVRDLLVREEGGDLWLAAGTPRRWLAPGQTIRFRQMPTTFGPVDLELLAGENEITGQVGLPLRNPASNAWLVLRLPEGKKIGNVNLDGRAWRQFDTKTGTIHLPAPKEKALLLRVKLATAR